MIQHPVLLLVPGYIGNITIDDLTLITAWASISLPPLAILAVIYLMVDSGSKLGSSVQFCCLLLAIAWVIFCLSFGGLLALIGVVGIGLVLSTLFCKKDLS